MVEKDAEKRARKEHQSAAGLAGLEATLRAGREADEVHNRLPRPEKVKSAADILREAREVAESIPVEQIACAECDEVIAEIESMREQEEKEEHKEPITNETKTVTEQLREARALLERLEKENSTS